MKTPEFTKLTCLDFNKSYIGQMAHQYILDTKNKYIVLKTTADVTHILNNKHKHGKIKKR